VEIAGDQGLSRQTAGHGDDFDVQTLVTIVAKFFGDEVGIINYSEAGEGDAQIFEFHALAKRRRHGNQPTQCRNINRQTAHERIHNANFYNF